MVWWCVTHGQLLTTVDLIFCLQSQCGEFLYFTVAVVLAVVFFRSPTYIETSKETCIESLKREDYMRARKMWNIIKKFLSCVYT